MARASPAIERWALDVLAALLAHEWDYLDRTAADDLLRRVLAARAAGSELLEGEAAHFAELGVELLARNNGAVRLLAQAEEGDTGRLVAAAIEAALPRLAPVSADLVQEVEAQAAREGVGVPASHGPDRDAVAAYARFALQLIRRLGDEYSAAGGFPEVKATFDDAVDAACAPLVAEYGLQHRWRRTPFDPRTVMRALGNRTTGIALRLDCWESSLSCFVVKLKRTPFLRKPKLPHVVESHRFVHVAELAGARGGCARLPDRLRARSPNDVAAGLELAAEDVRRWCDAELRGDFTLFDRLVEERDAHGIVLDDSNRYGP